MSQPPPMSPEEWTRRSVRQAQRMDFNDRVLGCFLAPLFLVGCAVIAVLIIKVALHHP